jgi:predicted nucleic acid-binding protein
MIVVVSDTSPIRYLIRIGEIGLLPKIYPTVVLPTKVLEELRASDGLAIVREWAIALPWWISVQSPSRSLDIEVPGLDEGERDVIALAEEVNAGLLLIDDRIGARVGLERGLIITGTLGVLIEAAQAGLVSIEHLVRKLQETNFRATPELYDRAVELARMQSPNPPRRKQE